MKIFRKLFNFIFPPICGVEGLKLWTTPLCLRRINHRDQHHDSVLQVWWWS